MLRLRDPTDEMMISLPAPDGPLTTAAVRLGAMAMSRVMRFLTQFFIFRSRNPWKRVMNGINTVISFGIMLMKRQRYCQLLTCMMTCPANVQLIVVLCPEAKSATAYTTELDLPKTF